MLRVNLEKEIERRIRARNLAGLQSLFAKLPAEKLGWRNENGESFLHIAMSCHSSEIFDWLYERLENHPIVFSVDNENRSLVWLATKKRKVDLAERLLLNQLTSEGFREKVRKFNDGLSLPNIGDLAAGLSQYLAAVRKRLDVDAWLKEDSSSGSTVFHLAAQHSSELLEFYFSFCERPHSYINRKNKNKNTPLHEACLAKSFDCIVVLINRGADLYLMDKENNHFLNWFEKADSATEDQKVDLFKCLTLEKQLEVLSYCKRYAEENEALKALYAKLLAERVALFPEKNAEAELNRFDHECSKGISRLMDEDRRTIDKLLKKIDAYLANLAARPQPQASYPRLFNGLARFVRVFRLAIIFYVAFYVTFYFIISPAMFASSFPSMLAAAGLISSFIPVSPAILLGIAAVMIPVLLIVAAVLFTKLISWFENKAKAPVVLVNPTEFSSIIADVDENLFKKCEKIQNEKSFLPVSTHIFLLLQQGMNQLKGLVGLTSLAMVSASFTNLKSAIERFKTDMINRNQSFSEGWRHRHQEALLQPQPQLQPQSLSQPQPQLFSLPRRLEMTELVAPSESKAEPTSYPEQEGKSPSANLSNESVTFKLAGHWAVLRAAAPPLPEAEAESAPSVPVPTSIGMDAEISDDAMASSGFGLSSRQRND